MLGKRGESLIEVVVSFGILSLVLTGVVNMTATVMLLASASRSTTEAVVLAQQGISRGIDSVSFRCSLFDEPEELVAEIPSDRLKLRVTLERLNSVEERNDIGSELNLVNDNNFRKIVSTVRWNDAGFPEERVYRITQIIKR